jgi:hypothetical protein
MASLAKKFFYSINLLGNYLINAKVNNPQDNEDIANKAYVDSKIQFISIDSLTTLNDELPLANRYNGLIFFVKDATLSDGTSTNGIVGKLYYFESDLVTPLPLYNLGLQYIIHQLIIDDEENYADLIDLLNTTYSRPGNIVTILPLNVTFLFDGTNWKYLIGNYNTSTEEIFALIPQILLEKNKRVIINNSIEKIILSNLSLSDEIIIVTELPINGENNRYYSINGNLWFFINGKYYQVNNKFELQTITLIKGSNIITHSLKSEFVLTFLKILNIENLEENNEISLINNTPINSDSLTIQCNFENINVELLMISKV